jgi:TatD DNase family protein
MIDSHCHLEQHDYDSDRDQVIEKCKEDLAAIVTCCAHPRDFELTMQMVEKHQNFIFASAGIHPEYIKEISEREMENFLELIKQNKEKISSVGETGLDYHWITEPVWQKKQKDLFIQMISFAKELDKPLTIHSRDAYEDVVKVLEQEDAKKIHLHLFGDNKLVKRIAENGWYISIGPIIIRSKKHFQIARDMPLEQLLLETDAPWNAPQVFLEGKKVRNDPTSIKIVAEKIAEIKGIPLGEVWNVCGHNAIKFFEMGL